MVQKLLVLYHILIVFNINTKYSSLMPHLNHYYYPVTGSPAQEILDADTGGDSGDTGTVLVSHC